MRLLNKSTVLGTTLVALAILNFSVLDQIGVGLVASVNDNFEDIGANWMALQTTNADLDAEELAQHLATVDGVHATASSLSWNQVRFGDNGPEGVEWLLPGDDYDLNALPYLFVFQEDEESGAAFYRDLIQWVDGSAPGANGFAASSDYAEDNGLQIGDLVEQTFGGNQFTGNGGTTVNLTLEGIYDRAYRDDSGNAFDILILGPSAQLRDQLAGTATGLRSSVLIEANLASILSTSDAIIDEAEAMGYTVSTEAFQIGGRTVGGRQGGGAPGGFGGGDAGGRGGAGGPPGGFTGGIQSTSDFTLYANGDALSSALDAAERAGTWFRMLTVSAAAMAVIGIAFVTAAIEKKVRRDVGIRQAVGYPLKRIWVHWATIALTMGLAGGLIGVGLVYALSASGLASFLLGIDVTFRSSVGVLIAPIASVAVFAIATLPTYARVLRSAPADNLRVLTE